ncbi:hypothetical protein [Methanolapillus africanus]
MMFAGTACADSEGIDGADVTVDGANAFYEITSPGTYTIKEDLINPAGTNPVILINASNVILEGNGKTVDGNGTSIFGIQVANDQKNITIQNVTIINATSAGIYTGDANNYWDFGNFIVMNVTVENIVSADGFAAGICAYSEDGGNVTITNSTIGGDGSQISGLKGIGIYANTTGNVTIEKCNVSGKIESSGAGNNSQGIIAWSLGNGNVTVQDIIINATIQTTSTTNRYNAYGVDAQTKSTNSGHSLIQNVTVNGKLNGTYAYGIATAVLEDGTGTIKDCTIDGTFLSSNAYAVALFDNVNGATANPGIRTLNLNNVTTPTESPLTAAVRLYGGNNAPNLSFHIDGCDFNQSKATNGISLEKSSGSTAPVDVYINNTTVENVINMIGTTKVYNLSVDNVTLLNVTNLFSGTTTPANELPLIPGYNIANCTGWTGTDDGWNLTITGSDKTYKMTDDIKINYFLISASTSNVTVDGANKNITKGSDYDGGADMLINAAGNDVTLKNMNVDISNSMRTNSNIVIQANGKNTTIANSVVKAGSSTDSSSQVIVVNNEGTIIENNTLVTGTSNTDTASTGNVGVRLYKNGQNVTVKDNKITGNATGSRNAGVSADGVTNDVTMTIQNNIFELNSSNGYMVYISPGADSKLINITAINNTVTGAKSILFADNVNNATGVKTVSISGTIQGNFSSAENFLDDSLPKNITLVNLTVYDGYKKTIPNTVSTKGTVVLNNLTFTNETYMIIPEDGNSLKITNSVFGKEGQNSSHAVLGSTGKKFSSISISNCVFEGNFRKGLLIYANTTDPSFVTIENNQFNGQGYDWKDQINKTSSVTIVANENTNTTFSNNTVNNYYKVLSIDHSPGNGNWTMTNNTYTNVVYALDINSAKDFEYNLTYSFFSKDGKIGTIPMVLDSGKSPEETYTGTKVNVYPYYTNAQKTEMKTDAATTKKVTEVVNSTFGDIESLSSNSDETAVKNVVDELTHLPVESIRQEMETPAGLADIQKLEALYENTSNVTVNVTKPNGFGNVTIVGAALSANPDTKVEMTISNEINGLEVPVQVSEKAIVLEINMSVTPLVPVQITMPLPEGMKNAIVIHCCSNGSIEQIPVTVSGNMMSFIVTGFSPFIIEEADPVYPPGSSGGVGSATVVDMANSQPMQPADNETVTPADTQNTTSANTTDNTGTANVDKPAAASSWTAWILVAVVLIIVVAAAVVLYRKNKK